MLSRGCLLVVAHPGLIQEAYLLHPLLDLPPRSSSRHGRRLAAAGRCSRRMARSFSMSVKGISSADTTGVHRGDLHRHFLGEGLESDSSPRSRSRSGLEQTPSRAAVDVRADGPRSRCGRLLAALARPFTRRYSMALSMLARTRRAPSCSRPYGAGALAQLLDQWDCACSRRAKLRRGERVARGSRPRAVAESRRAVTALSPCDALARASRALIKELRERTGAGMADCKKALVECEAAWTRPSSTCA